MKYDLHLDGQDTNTSHVQVLDLVGTDKRVLDVGCSTGYLAAALKGRGNRVTGVELDPDAGALARPHLEHLVIGNLETMDLAAEVGEHAFDVIVFADVLEHLTNPLSVLSQAPGLLAPGGSVVVSIPNIAHGAVRLALLQGRFEYRDLGLLDDTHVRFFTRSSVDELHRLAGLVPVEHRRTEADPFRTEIPLRAGDFPAEVIESLRQDADASTYQFVVRSVAGVRAPSGDVAAELVARNEEILELRSQLAQVSVIAPRSQPPTVGVLISSDVGQPADELRALVIGGELRRRLPGWAVRTYDEQTSEARPGPDGAPVAPLVISGPPTARSTSVFDAAVLAGTWGPQEARAVISSIEGDGCTAHIGAVAGCQPGDLPQARRPGAVAGFDGTHPGGLVPDPLLLAGRLSDPAALGHRAAVLAALGQLPDRGFIAVSVAGGHPAALGRAVNAVAADREVPVAVIADPDGDPAGATAKAVAAECDRATVAVNGLDAYDQLAAVHAASVVLSDQPGLLWLAVALGTPCVGLVHEESAEGELAAIAGWLDDPDLLATSPGAVAAAIGLAERRATGAGHVSRAADELELFLDELAESLAAAGQRLLSASWPARLAEANHRVSVLEATNEGLRFRLLKQRLGFGQVARRALAAQPATGTSEARILADKVVRAEAEVARMQAEVADFVHQIEATENTLTMRTLRPARRLYGRLRRP